MLLATCPCFGLYGWISASMRIFSQRELDRVDERMPAYRKVIPFQRPLACRFWTNYPMSPSQVFQDFDHELFRMHEGLPQATGCGSSVLLQLHPHQNRTDEDWFLIAIFLCAVQNLH